MIKTRKRTVLLFSILLLMTASLSFSCEDDDDATLTITPVFVPEAFRATITNAVDVSNTKNASDIVVNFNGGITSNITAYRVFYVLSENIALVNEESASALSANSFLQLESSASALQINLAESQLDFEGEPIVADQDYVAYVLTVGTFDNETVYVLSNPSSVFQLVNKLEAATLIGSDFPANDGLFVGSDGTIFASNFGVFDQALNKYNGTQVFQITPSGAISEKASGVEAPMGGVMDSNGNFYFTNENNNDLVSGVLLKVTPDGTTSAVAEIDGWPSGLTIDANDNIYAANFALPVINKITPDGTVSVFATADKLAGCVGIDIDSQGNIVTANFATADILSIDTSGEVSLITTIPNVTQGFGIGYMTIFEDNIYATGINDNFIFKVSFDGTSEIFAGTGERGNQDGELNVATFSNPNGIAADDERRILYISQFGTPGLRTIQF